MAAFRRAGTAARRPQLPSSSTTFAAGAAATFVRSPGTAAAAPWPASAPAVAAAAGLCPARTAAALLTAPPEATLRDEAATWRLLRAVEAAGAAGTGFALAAAFAQEASASCAATAGTAAASGGSDTDSLRRPPARRLAAGGAAATALGCCSSVRCTTAWLAIALSATCSRPSTRISAGVYASTTR